MQDILEDLFYGNISPLENLRPLSSEYKDFLSELCDENECFEKNLTPELKVKYNEVKDLQMKLSLIEIKQSFIDGFKLGANLIMKL